MPANLKELRGRIRNVKSTQQITKAMKLVSAAKFGRAQQSVVQSRPYFAGLEDLCGRLRASGRVSEHALVRDNGSDRCLMVVVSSQRGLCGGYNANVAKEALICHENLRKEFPEVDVLCLGRKGYQLLQSRLTRIGYSFEPKMIGLKELREASHDGKALANGMSMLDMTFDKPTVEQAEHLVSALVHYYRKGTYGKVIVVYSRFGSAILQTPTQLDFLPISGATEEGTAEELDYTFEPDFDDIVHAVLPRFLKVQILQVLKEAMASEHGARMTAMDNATRNASDMERRYKVQYQRARQAAITTELVEIISGAEAL